VFGYFEDMRQKAFRTDRYTGVARSARGHSLAFNDIYSFEGPLSFPQQFVFVFDLASKTGLHLSPWVVRGLDTGDASYGEPDFFLFDIAPGDEYGFKAVQEREGVTVAKGGAFVELYEAMVELMQTDPKREPITGFEFTLRTFS
jgi:hypothetical protein